MLDKINKLVFYKILFFLTGYISLTITNLFYMSTISPDFNRYKIYLYYFFGGQTDILPEQGFIYFFIIALFCKLQIQNFNGDFENLMNSVGNQVNFNISNLSAFENKIHLGIQYGNFVIFMFGIFGIYQLLKIRNTSLIDIYKILTIVTILPLSLQLRLTMKPEILAFALLPFVILFYEKYLKNKNTYDLIALATTTSVILTLKASITGMILVVFGIKLLSNLKKINIRKITILIFITICLISAISYENYSISNYSIFERSELSDYFDQDKYNNRVTPDVFFNINLQDLILNPDKNYHANSLVGITLIDTFGDYFNEYWNKDYTFLKTYRKQFIQSGSSLDVDIEKNVLTVPFPIFNLEKIRKLFGLSLSILFFIHIFKIFRNKHNDKIYIISPLFGILILMLSALGFPENNFNPETGDTFKAYYYSFLSILALSLVLQNYVKNKSLSFFKIAIYIPVILFLIGFPMENNTYLDSQLYIQNSYTLTCSMDKHLIDFLVIEEFEYPCFESANFNNPSITIVNLPWINILIFLLMLSFIFHSFFYRKFFRDFLRSLNTFQ
jgi:hypothetical protein